MDLGGIKSVGMAEYGKYCQFLANTDSIFHILTEFQKY
jgi:hypothetical protein